MTYLNDKNGSPDKNTYSCSCSGNILDNTDALIFFIFQKITDCFYRTVEHFSNQQNSRCKEYQVKIQPLTEIETDSQNRYAEDNFIGYTEIHDHCIIKT